MMKGKKRRLSGLALSLLSGAIVSCSDQAELPPAPEPVLSGGTGNQMAGVGGSAVAGLGAESGTGATGVGGAAGTGAAPGGPMISVGGQAPMASCQPITCTELGYQCGYIVDECGNTVDCAAEGLSCGPLQACTGGLETPTVCVSSLGDGCTLCGDVPDCTAAAQPTRLTGRVVTPGRDDANTLNQVGVPNAVVYILSSNDPAQLSPVTSGIPTGGTSCDRCEDQDLGQVLAGAITDATGAFTLEGNIPIGVEFVLVVKAGRFRRAVQMTLPETAACATTTLPSSLPENPTRLPRSMTDGLAVNIPRFAVTTGAIDAMECVLEKMGIAHTEFGNPGADGTAAPRVHLYRGGSATGMGMGMGMAGGAGAPAGPPGSGARIDDSTPHDTTLYGDLARLQSYDVVIADCESAAYDQNFTQRDSSGANVREYVNRGGRLFGSHLSFTWLHENGDAPYTEADPIATGLGPAATWVGRSDDQSDTGTGMISVGRPQASPRIQSFADWMARESVIVPPDLSFSLTEPRSINTGLGASSEEFVYRSDGNMRVQQFSFNTPYGAPPEAACGRVAYSGFHVSIGDASQAIFPMHCAGDLTNQEKVLLYMLLDLSACVGEVPPPPDCTPQTCESIGAECGFSSDGCGAVLDCGPCKVEPPK